MKFIIGFAIGLLIGAYMGYIMCAVLTADFSKEDLCDDDYYDL